MAYYGVGLTTAIQEIVFRFRNHVAKANPYCTVSRIKYISYIIFKRNIYKI